MTKVKNKKKPEKQVNPKGEQEIAAADEILEALLDGVAISGLEGNLIYGNKELAKIFGYDTIKEMIGMKHAQGNALPANLQKRR